MKLEFPKYLHWGGSLETAPKFVPAGGISLIRLDGGRSVVAHNAAQEKAYRAAGYQDGNANPDWPKALHAPHSTPESPVQVHANNPEEHAALIAGGCTEGACTPPTEADPKPAKKHKKEKE